jgi:hypothetical protein
MAQSYYYYQKQFVDTVQLNTSMHQILLTYLYDYANIDRYGLWYITIQNSLSY